MAGGWVRDKVSTIFCLKKHKLLGKHSSDIDIALDTMFGEDLAKILSEELYPGKGPKFGVVKQNSDKSKHLETACMKVHDVGLDFVNLRSE